MMYQNESNCRVCGSGLIEPIVEFGPMPLKHHLMQTEQVEQTSLQMPLTLMFCEGCALVQLRETLDPTIFGVGQRLEQCSRSAELAQQDATFIEDIVHQWSLTHDSLVIHANSGDGSLLQQFMKHGVSVLGLEPYGLLAGMANKAGIETQIESFTENLAGKLVLQGKAATIFLSINLLSTLSALNSFVAGIKTILIPRGAAVIEVPYIVTLIDEDEVASIQHNQLSYFSLTTLDYLFRQHGLYINAVVNQKGHNKSLRVIVEPFERVQPSVKQLLHAEVIQQVNDIAYFRAFAERITARHQLMLP